MPASSASLPLLNRVAARVGSADDVRGGESTCAREMRETADILARATPSTLVVVDEIGRGTSTADGTALAYAVCRTLAEDPGPLSLFATHFSELADLEEETGGRVRNVHVDAHVDGSALTLLYEVRDGPTFRSFGVECARLARFPAAVVDDARRRLAASEGR